MSILMMSKQYLVVLLICSNVISNLHIHAQSDFFCEFTSDICGMKQSSGDDSNWIRHRGTTASRGTGPFETKTDYYVYYEASGPRGYVFAKEGEIAGLETPVLTNMTTSACVCLDYQMWGLDMGKLELYLGDNLTNSRTQFFGKSGPQGEKWKSVMEDVKIQPHERLIIKAICGKGLLSDIAVDNINVLLTPCDAINKWNEWGEWSNCSGTCGTGTRDRSRICSVCPPCTGNTTQTDSCTPDSCAEPASAIPMEPTCCCKVQGDPHISGFDDMSVFVDVAKNETCKMVTTLNRTINPNVCTYEVNTKFGANLTPTRLIIKISPVINSIEYTYEMPPSNAANPTNLPYVAITNNGNTWALIADDSTCQLQISLIMNKEAKMCVQNPDPNLEFASQGLCGNCNQQFDDYYLSNGTSVMHAPNKFELMKDSFCHQPALPALPALPSSPTPEIGE